MLSKLLAKAAKTPLRKWFVKNSETLSQAGQDYWIYAEAFNEKEGGYFLDIGAHDGIYISNTYLLESRYNWQGICVEANPATFSELKKNRRAKCLNICLDRSEGEVDFVLRDVMGGIKGLDNDESNIGASEVVKLKTMPLERVLSEHHAPNIIDYLSIDVEGAEERILADFDFNKYMFRCITIERPTELLKKLFDSHGYVLIKEVAELDCFYVHKDFMKEYMKNLYWYGNKKHLSIRWE